MDTVTIIGLMAGVLTTLSFLPQVVKIWKLKETKDISLEMYIMLGTGILLWFIYGLCINEIPVIAANGVSLVLVSCVISLKLKYG